MHRNSYWHDTLEPTDTRQRRPPLPRDTSVDVVIVGAGFTGLWTAYCLLRRDSTTRVCVLERDEAGFGASGRNGGWCVGEMYSDPAALERHEAGGYARTFREMQRSVDEIGVTAIDENIACHYRKSGAVFVATDLWQLQRLERLVELRRSLGLGDSYHLLSPREVTGRVNVASACGGMFTPHAAAVHPARLARGLARAVERLGGIVYEGTTVSAITPGRVRTEHGDVRAEVVVRATEGYTRTLDGHHRDLVPLGNHMVATEVLDRSTWDEIGVSHRELFEITVPMVAYAQRTHDGRIAIGGLGAPYRFGSVIPDAPMSDPSAANRLRRFLGTTFPCLRDVRISHTWGGIMGVPRDIRPSVGFDRSTGLAWAGGYFGVGVAPAHAAGRTLADLITGRDTDRTTLPWVDHRSPTWEPEPIRWIGINARKVGVRARARAERHRLVRRPGDGGGP